MMKCYKPIIWMIVGLTAQMNSGVSASEQPQKETAPQKVQSKEATTKKVQTQKAQPKTQFPRYKWDDLVPDAEKVYPRPPPAVIDHTGTQQAPQERGNVRPELDTKQMQLPGYAVPLKGDNKKVTDFLLVPYFGACVHLPPPPTNQVVLVTYPKGAPRDLLYDAIWVKGTLHTVEYKHFEGVASSYHIASVDILEYDFDADQEY